MTDGYQTQPSLFCLSAMGLKDHAQYFQLRQRACMKLRGQRRQPKQLRRSYLHPAQSAFGAAGWFVFHCLPET